jgi:hypothetical protein
MISAIKISVQADGSASSGRSPSSGGTSSTSDGRSSISGQTNEIETIFEEIFLNTFHLVTKAVEVMELRKG